MLAADKNRLLTEVEGEAPMGRLMRERHWIPCARSAGLDPGGPPKRVRLLGRNYVAFRAEDGRIGLFDEACPHRGASLVLARSEGCAIRCIFHGWKLDVSGKVVEVPSEGAGSAEYAARVRVAHYPTFEGGGLLWVWLGTGAPPPKPPLPFLDLPAENVFVTRTTSRCNWLQGVEATLDSVHVGTLHTSWIQAAPRERNSTIVHALRHHPRYEVEDTDYGLRAAALRTLDQDQQYLRVTEYVLPFVSLVPAQGARSGSIFISVPMDDVTHMLFWGIYDEDGPADMRIEEGFRDGERDLDDYASFKGDAENSWGQDRAAMAAGHFSGFTSCLLQEDVVVQTSMGPVVDRTKEQLTPADLAVARLRARLLTELARSGSPARVQRPPSPTPARPLDLIAAVDVDWRTHGTAEPVAAAP